MLIGIDASRAVSDSPTGTEVYSRELIRALVLQDRDNRYRLYTRSSQPGGLVPAAANVEIRAIPFPRLWTHVRLALEMRTRPPDILFVPAHVLPPIRPRHAVVTIHDLGHLYFPEAYPLAPRAYHRWTTRWNAAAASHILADSEATRDDLQRLCRVPATKITVVYPGYDADVFRPAEDEAVRAARARFRIDRDYILAIGTVHPRKNYARLIEAFARLAGLGLDLVIAGKRGWLTVGIQGQVEKLGLGSRVRFLDYVPTAELPALITGARLLAFPSLHEGFGLPVLEAQACGTPVVCSMTSSLPEAAGDGALFIDPCDVDALAAAMGRLLTDDALRAKLIDNGFRNIKRFTWESAARIALDVFEALMEGETDR